MDRDKIAVELGMPDAVNLVLIERLSEELALLKSQLAEAQSELSLCRERLGPAGINMLVKMKAELAEALKNEQSSASAYSELKEELKYVERRYEIALDQIYDQYEKALKRNAVLTEAIERALYGARDFCFDGKESLRLALSGEPTKASEGDVPTYGDIVVKDGEVLTFDHDVVCNNLTILSGGKVHFTPRNDGRLHKLIVRGTLDVSDNGILEREE